MKTLPQPPPRTRRKSAHKKGQTMVEYVIILAVLTVVGVASFTLMKARISTIFSDIANILDTAQSSS